jgi:hypothetical protein
MSLTRLSPTCQWDANSISPTLQNYNGTLYPINRIPSTGLTRSLTPKKTLSKKVVIVIGIAHQHAYVHGCNGFRTSCPTHCLFGTRVFLKKWFFYAIMNRQASGEFLQLHEWKVRGRTSTWPKGTIASTPPPRSRSCEKQGMSWIVGGQRKRIDHN